MRHYTVTFTAEQFERIRRSLQLLDHRLPQVLSSWIAGRVEHAARQDAQEAEAREAIEEHLGKVRGDWLLPGTVSTLARIVALVRKGKTVEAAEAAERLEFLREPLADKVATAGPRTMKAAADMAVKWALSSGGEHNGALEEAALAYEATLAEATLPTGDGWWWAMGPGGAPPAPLRVDGNDAWLPGGTTLPIRAVRWIADPTDPAKAARVAPPEAT